MPKGPLGGPRPFSQYRIIIDPHERDVFLIKVGPLGGPRPFAKNNPPVREVEVRECVLSDAGKAFGAGVVSGGSTKNVEDLSNEEAEAAFRLAEKWCRGILEATTMDEKTEREVNEDFERIGQTLGAVAIPVEGRLVES